MDFLPCPRRTAELLLVKIHRPFETLEFRGPYWMRGVQSFGDKWALWRITSAPCPEGVRSSDAKIAAPVGLNAHEHTRRQLPDQSTTLWVESSSTDDSRLRGALPIADLPGSIRVFAVYPTNQSSRHFEPMRQPSEGSFVVLYRPCLIRETQLELERRSCQSCSEVRRKLMRSMSSRY